MRCSAVVVSILLLNLLLLLLLLLFPVQLLLMRLSAQVIRYRRKVRWSSILFSIIRCWQSSAWRDIRRVVWLMHGQAKAGLMLARDGSRVAQIAAITDRASIC